MMLLIFFVLLAPFTPKIDLWASNLCYSLDRGFYNNSLFSILFHYGELFGLATGLVACILFLFSFLKAKWKRWRMGSLAMILTLVIGAGLITNVGFKGYWGRPRPKQILEFGGKHAYRPFWKPNFRTQHDPQKSFPSGHVAMGCYFFSFIFLGKRYNRPVLFWLGCSLVFLLGGGLMITRVVQGGHFVSDVIASFVLMWYVAKACDTFTWAASVRRLFGLNS